MKRLLARTLLTIGSGAATTLGFTVGALGRGLVSGTRASVRLAKHLRTIGPELRCPMGCPPQAADGTWECAGCRARFVGWVWSPCPACGATPGWVPCRTCGHVIRNQQLD